MSVTAISQRLRLVINWYTVCNLRNEVILTLDPQLIWTCNGLHIPYRPHNTWLDMQAYISYVPVVSNSRSREIYRTELHFLSGTSLSLTSGEVPNSFPSLTRSLLGEAYTCMHEGLQSIACQLSHTHAQLLIPAVRGYPILVSYPDGKIGGGGSRRQTQCLYPPWQRK